MRDTKSSLLLVLSLFLLSISLVLLTIWGFHFYNTAQKEKEQPNSTIASPAPAIITSNTFHDSLQKIYAATIDKLATGFDSTKNSTGFRADTEGNKLIEINKLKEEIAIILKNNYNLADLGTAREKIVDLQRKVEQLQNRNLDVEKENKRLSALLEQLVNKKEEAKQNIKQPTAVNKLPSDKIIGAPAFFASDLRLLALKLNDNNKEEETSEADETEKLAGSFTVKSKSNQNSSADIIVVVLQPNGQVLQNSIWESGTFDTPEGKKNYSQKIHFNYSNGEAKQLVYSLTLDKFQEGNYIVQIYYNGSVIARMVKVLS
jgi:hypothetical protein